GLDLLGQRDLLLLGQEAAAADLAQVRAERVVDVPFDRRAGRLLGLPVERAQLPRGEGAGVVVRAVGIVKPCGIGGWDLHMQLRFTRSAECANRGPKALLGQAQALRGRPRSQKLRQLFATTSV